LRKEARRNRRAIPGERAAAGALALRDRALPFFAERVRTTVSGYVPTRAELDIMPLLAALDAMGFRIALPAIVEGLELEFRAYRPGDALHPGIFRLQEPDSAADIIQPEIILLPLLAFDKKGIRLGYGGGYYDATLRSLRRRGAPVTSIGVAFDEQEIEALPREAHDEPLDWLLTPTRFFRCGDS
jgi:5-formyltetrahydrofolate cyclo-ligase